MSSSSNRLQKLLGFWEKDRNNQSLALDILALHKEQSSLEKAQQFYQSLDKTLQNQSDICWSWGQIQLAKCAFSGAFDTFQSMPVAADGSTQYAMAMCLFFEQDFKQAKSLLEQLIASSDVRRPDEVYLLLARTQYHLGDLEGAYRVAKELLEQNSLPDAELHGLLSMLAFDLNLIDEADQFAEHTRLQDPFQHDGLLAKASVMVARQHAGAAREYAQKGTAKHPSSGRMWSVLGQAWLLETNVEHAYQAVLKATELMPEHIGTWHVRAWCELIQSQFDLAQASFQAALTLNPNFAESHGGLAVVAFHQGRLEESTKLAKKAIRLDPGCFSGRYALSLLAKREGKQDASDAILKELIKQESHLAGLSYAQLLQLREK